MRMLPVLQKWYSVSPWILSTQSLAISYVDVHAALIFKQLKARLKEIIFQTNEPCIRVYLEGKIDLLPDLRILSHYREGVALSRLFSTVVDKKEESRRDGHLLNTTIVQIAEDAIHKASIGSLDHLEFIEVLNKFQDLVFQHEERLNGSNLATLIHRIGKLSTGMYLDPYTTHALLIERLIRLLEDRYVCLSPLESANIIWGLGKMRGKRRNQTGIPVVAEKATNTIIQHFAESKRRPGPQIFSNLVIGIAYLGVESNKQLLPLVVKRGMLLYRQMEGQELSNTAWALTKLGFADTNLFLPLLYSRAGSIMGVMLPKHIAMVMWSMAKSSYAGSIEFCKETVRVFCKIDRCSFSTALVLWSLHKMNIRPKDEELTQLVRPFLRSAEISPKIIRDLTMMITVLADFGYRDSPLDSLVEVVKMHFNFSPSSFSQQDICNFLWALIIIDDPSIDLKFLQQMYACLVKRGLERLDVIDSRQFYQCVLHCRAFSGLKAAVIPYHMEKTWKKMWSARQETSPLPLWVAEVLRAANDMGYPCRGRYVEQGLINTTVVDIKDGFGSKYALEGISFLRSYKNDLDRPVARYLWKVRLLEAMGYVVIPIKEIDWLSLTSEDSRKEYLRQMVAEAQKSRLTGRSLRLNYRVC